MLPTLVTVYCAEPGVRISTVTAHGEQVVEAPSEEARLLGLKLWTAIIGQELTGGVDISPRISHLEGQYRDVLLALKDTIGALQQRAATLEAKWESNRPDRVPDVMKRLSGVEEGVASLRERVGQIADQMTWVVDQLKRKSQ